MSESLVAPPVPAEKSRRRWPFLVALLVPVLLLVGGYVYLATDADRQLRAAFADAERTDPRWRLEEIEADRGAVPEGQNAAAWVLGAKRLLPANWPAWQYPPPGTPSPQAEQKRVALAESFEELEPQRQLSEEQTAALRAELKKAAGALGRARKVADLPQGRYPISYSPDFISTLLPHVQSAREVAYLLSLDALLRAQDGDANGALASCRAALNAGRSIGDEPTLISQLVRMACRTMAVSHAQRVLAQGEPSDTALLELQRALEEEKEPLFLIGVRGERAGMDRLLEMMQTGKVRVTLQLIAGLSGSNDQATALDSLALLSPAVLKGQRAALLRRMNRVVEIARLPTEERPAAFAELKVTLKKEPILVRLLAPAVDKVDAAERRSRAQLRCAVVALAAERYRRARGHWPERLEELTAEGDLSAVPTDPYDGRPLRWHRLDDGAVVYAVGPDGRDDGGNLDPKHPDAAGTDIGFRLWDVAQRRQPPAPPKPAPAAVDEPVPDNPPGVDDK